MIVENGDNYESIMQKMCRLVYSVQLKKCSTLRGKFNLFKLDLILPRNILHFLSCTEYTSLHIFCLILSYYAN